MQKKRKRNSPKSANLGDQIAIFRFRVVQLRKYSRNSRCCPFSCLLDVLAMFLANSSPTYSL